MSSVISIDSESLKRIVLMTGGKCVVCESKMDYTPYAEPGQKNIDYITEPRNQCFGLRESGEILKMYHPDDFSKALDNQIPLTMIFSLPIRSFGFQILEGRCIN